MSVNILGFDIPTWLLVGVPLAYVYYRYLTWNHKVLMKLGIPGPKPLPILGTLHLTFRKGLFKSQMDSRMKYGKIFGTYLGGSPVINIADPDILKEIMIKRFNQFPNRLTVDVKEYITEKFLTMLKDDHWKHVRHLMSPSFSTTKLRVMTGHVRYSSEVLVKNLMVKADSGESFEFREYTGAYTADVIASTGFGLQIDSQNDRQNKFVQYIDKLFTNFSFRRPSILLLFLFPSGFKFLQRLGLVHLFSSDIRDYFHGIVTQAIELRTQNKLQQPDFLQLMMNAHLDDPDPDNTSEDIKFLKDDPGLWSKQGLTHEEIIAQSILLISAGYETTANTLAFVGYCLAVNPDCQEQLIEEIDTVMEGETEPNYDLLKKLTYMDMVLSETMRLYPAAPRMDRIASEDVNIDGLVIPKNMLVSIPFYILHHDPEAWPEPEQFRPERFTAEEKAKRHPYQWMPFGAGPRRCLGMRLALVEMKMTLVYLLQNFRFKTCEKTPIPMKLMFMRMLPEDGMYLKVEKRTEREQ